MAQALQIDTLAFSKKLRDAGADEKLAEAIVEGITAADTSELATKADIAEVKANIAAVQTEVKADIAAVQTEVKADIAAVRLEVAERFESLYRQLWVMMAGVVGLTVTLIKLLP